MTRDRYDPLSWAARHADHDGCEPEDDDMRRRDPDLISTAIYAAGVIVTALVIGWLVGVR